MCLDTFDSQHIHTINGKGNFYANQATIQSQNNSPRDMVEFTAGLAAVNYEEALDLDSTNVNALNGLGNMQIILEQYDKAIEYFVTSFGIDKNRITTLNGLAYAHLKSDNLELAASFYEKTLDKDANNYDALSGLLLIYVQQDKQSKVNETLDRLEQFKEKVVESLIHTR